MAKPCNCNPERRGGNHYGWCDSLEKEVEKPKVEEPKIKKPCNCNPERRGGNHYPWCDSLEK